MLGSVAGLLGVIAQYYSPNGLFAFLVNASGALILAIYLTMVISHVRLRHQAIAVNRSLPMPMWWFPWLSYLTIAAIAAVLLAMALTPALQTQFWTSALSIVVTLGAYAYVAYRRESPSARE
jgi:AAT family amino acid transporter/GABA permease